MNRLIHTVFALAIALFLLPIALANAAEAPSATNAKETLEKSTRHGEYASIPLEGSDVKLKAFVVYPEVKDKAPVVIVIHEIFGLTEWVSSVADAFAKEGFIAIAPDLISGIPGAEENAREAIGKLDEAEVIKRLNATKDYATKLPAASGKFGCVGFCWGGKTSFLYATAQPDLGAAVVYYGASPDAAKIASIKAPVLGFYGENDNRVNSTIPAAEEEMKKLGKSYEKNIMTGAGHGFLRQQDGNEANLKASQEAWPKTVEFLKTHTK
jgi:carboxymethylenebutenolidase